MTSIVTTLTETRKFGPESEMDFLRHFDWYYLQEEGAETGKIYHIAILPALGLAGETTKSVEQAKHLVKIKWDNLLEKLQAMDAPLFLGVNSPITSLQKCGDEICLDIDYQKADAFLAFFEGAKPLPVF